MGSIGSTFNIDQEQDPSASGDEGDEDLELDDDSFRDRTSSEEEEIARKMTKTMVMKRI